jgi:hypothetical protein
VLLSRYRITQRPSDLRRASEVHDQLAARDDVDEQVLVARAQLLWERYATEDDADLLTRMIEILEPVVAEIPDDMPLWRSAALELANGGLEAQWRFGGADTAGPLLAAAASRTPRASPLWARLQHAEGLRHWQAYLTSGDLSRLAEALVA